MLRYFLKKFIYHYKECMCTFNKVLIKIKVKIDDIGLSSIIKNPLKMISIQVYVDKFCGIIRFQNTNFYDDQQQVLQNINIAIRLAKSEI
ncbi:hypothetical protein BpHYR1_019476 [Brachionus plicatilis]|uniref:Uncharacterized protein n=1 Tax=Brachionus plicatilis TaxID=10195 RepID=A0A3M7RBR1_BRAPC|nr:hypothetical protein BpHYR1_019476 [Brachionus plicatilis]